jgi:hypothetical protein
VSQINPFDGTLVKILLIRTLSEKALCPDHQIASGFIQGGKKVKSRKYPWIGVFFHQGKVICGSNLSTFFNLILII